MAHDHDNPPTPAVSLRDADAPRAGFGPGRGRHRLLPGRIPVQLLLAAHRPAPTATVALHALDEHDQPGGAR